MAFFTALTLAGGALAISAATRRKPTPPRLVNVLVDGKPKQATLLLPRTQRTLLRARELTQEFFGDTRQQYQHALNTTYDISAEQRAEQVQKQNLVMAASGLGLGIAGAMLPGIVGIAGTLLLGWGMTVCVLLMQTSTPVGVYNAVKPLLDERSAGNNRDQIVKYASSTTANVDSL